ncbi:hypothetical protein C1645_819287 [Glomus cerebriforme]|uniref:Uncharacterized protein n=1 Tax=Glomus cerebriforme TaxID=658196 RepID=A0A397TEZ0_9GLOM|nr:hypothetical protein C1645_819287 [Glomus cerebriforme]
MSDIYKDLERNKALHEKEKHEENGKRYKQEELASVMEKGEKLLDVIVISIREKETEENLLGNRKLLKYGYIIEDDEVDRRFVKLEEWLREKEIAIMDIGHDTMSHFKEMLHMEESIANEESRDTVRKFQKSLTYRWWDKSELGQVEKLIKEWKGEEDIRTIGKINLMLEKEYELEEIERNELIRNVLIDNEVDIQELKRKLEDGKLPLRVKGKMTLKNKDDDEREKEIIIAEKWREKGHISITIAKIKRLLRLGYDESRVENDIELINSVNDELKIKLNELDDETETEKRLKGLERINESLGVNITEEELVRLIKMEFKNVDIINKEFIKLFQENKNEKEENIKEILDEYLRKQIEIGELREMTQEKKCVKCDWKIPRVGGKIRQAMEEHCEKCHLGKRTFEGCEIDEYEEFSKREESFKKEIREGEYFWNGEKYEKIKAIITEDIDEWIRENMESFGMKDNDKEENLECKICGNKGYNEENCVKKKGKRFQDRKEIDYWEENIEDEKDDTDNSEKIGEILSPGEHEEWNENIENINENEIEDELQNIINTGCFGLS